MSGLQAVLLVVVLVVVPVQVVSMTFRLCRSWFRKGYCVGHGVGKDTCSRVVRDGADEVTIGRSCCGSTCEAASGHVRRGSRVGLAALPVAIGAARVRMGATSSALGGRACSCCLAP